MNFGGVFDLLKNLEAVKPLFEQAYNSVVITTAELELPGPQILYANKAFCKITGYELNELLNKTPRILQGEKTDRGLLDSLKSTLKSGGFFQGNTTNYRKDGSTYWVEWNISPIYDSDGKLSCYFSVQHDISAQREQLTKLTNVSKQLEMIFKNNAAGIFVGDENRDIVVVNERFCEIVGYSKEELVGHSAAMIHLSQESYLAFAPNFLSAKNRHRVKIEYPFRRKDGSSVWCEFFGTKIELNEQKTALFGVFWIFRSVKNMKKL